MSTSALWQICGPQKTTFASQGIRWAGCGSDALYPDLALWSLDHQYGLHKSVWCEMALPVYRKYRSCGVLQKWHQLACSGSLMAETCPDAPSVCSRLVLVMQRH